jgi:hypothetical protein
MGAGMAGWASQMFGAHPNNSQNLWARQFFGMVGIGSKPNIPNLPNKVRQVGHVI